MNLRYALIGCGRISPNNIQAAINNNMEIVALCDIVLDRAKEKAAMFNLENSKIYQDYIEMLNNEKIDLVAIATESGKHAKIAIDCIRHKCNVIIEKPIALSLSDADEIIKAAQEEDVKVCACHQNRFNKSIQKIREALEAGKFGRLLHGTAHIRWNRNEDYYKQAPWRGTWEQDGGALMNQCIHNIDLLRWMMGDEIESIVAYTANLKHDYIEAEDLGMALIRFKNGALGMIEGTTNVYPSNLEETLYIFGDKATVKAGGKSVNKLEVWKIEGEENDSDILKQYSEDPKNVYGFGHTPLYKDVKEAILNNRPPYIDANAGKRALELVLAIYKSAKEHKEIKFPLSNCSSTDFK